MSIVLIGAKSKEKDVSGQSIAFDHLVSSYRPGSGLVYVIDINLYTQTPLRKAFFYFGRFWQLIKIFLTKKVSAVYLTISQEKVGFYRDFVFIWLSYFFRKNIIVHLHGGNYKIFYQRQSKMMQSLIRATLNKVDRIVLLSDVFTDLFDFVDGYLSKTAVVENGIPTPVAISNVTRNDLSEIRILFLSNLIESKGYLDVLEAVKILVHKYGRKVKATFCGKFMVFPQDKLFKSASEAADFFNNYVQSNALGENIEFKGLVTGHEKEKLLQESHFILLPSYYFNEGQPISIIEGLANGCVPVCTDYRDLPNMVIDKWNGIIVEQNNAEDIAGKIYAVDEKAFDLMSTNSRKLFIEKYTLDSHIHKLKQIFNEHI